MNVRSAACLNSCRYSKCQTAVETELLGTAEPGLQVKSTSDVTETLTSVGSDTPAQMIAVDATVPVRVCQAEAVSIEVAA